MGREWPGSRQESLTYLLRCISIRYVSFDMSWIVASAPDRLMFSHVPSN